MRGAYSAPLLGVEGRVFQVEEDRVAALIAPVYRMATDRHCSNGSESISLLVCSSERGVLGRLLTPLCFDRDPAVRWLVRPPDEVRLLVRVTPVTADEASVNVVMKQERSIQEDFRDKLCDNIPKGMIQSRSFEAAQPWPLLFQAERSGRRTGRAILRETGRLRAQK